MQDMLTRALFRGSRLLDVPGIIQHLDFAKARRRYYDLFWARAAAETGATVQKWEDGFSRLTRDGTTLIVRGPDLRLDDHLTLRIMGNKALTYRLLMEQGLEVPRHARFRVTSERKAVELLQNSQRPLVVKPNSGTGGGRGVTTGITSLAGLRKAALWASRFDIDLIAEEQIEGASWRLLFIDGRFLDAVRRDPPRVTGDGRRSIRGLIKAENARRLAGNPFTALSPIRLDRESFGYLAAQGLKPGSVPEAGETVVVKRASNENSKAENHSLKSAAHPATIAACAQLAQNLGVRLAGIDVIARDIALPLGNGNGLIGEINTTPGLHHHDLVAAPRTGRSVAAELIDYMFETRSGAVVEPGKARPVAQLRIAAG